MSGIISALLGWLHMYAMPEGTPAPLRCAARTAVVLAVILTAVALACEARAVPPRWADLAAPFAGAAWVIAALCWVQAVHDDSERRMFTRALAAALARLPEEHRREVLQAVSGR